MNIRLLRLLGLISLASLTQPAHAQKAEASLNYSLVVYNPAKSIAGGRNLNGGGGSIGLLFGDRLTLNGEFQGYATTTLSFHLPETANSAPGTIETEGRMFTYLFGLS